MKPPRATRPDNTVYTKPDLDTRRARNRRRNRAARAMRRRQRP